MALLRGYYQNVYRTIQRTMFSTKPKTGIVMLNMGGPQHLDQVGEYLHRIMTDRDMIQLPFQHKLGPWIAQRRTEDVKKKYLEIGGGSPILKWTERQGKLLCQELDRSNPEGAPHKHYVAFRYVSPFTHEALSQLEKDGVSRAVIFSQYPQYSCATTGSSLNAIVDYFKGRDLPEHIEWSIVERWGSSPLLGKVVADRIATKLAKFDPQHRDDVLLLFSAHSLPLKAVSRGDTYPSEVAASMGMALAWLRAPNPYRLVWQSKVGPLPWLQPYTEDAIRQYSRQGHARMLLVPIAFVNEHIETLHELDIEYRDLATQEGVVQLERADAPNDHPVFIKAMAEEVRRHLARGPALSRQLLSRCAHCTSDRCARSKRFLRALCAPTAERLARESSDPARAPDRAPDPALADPALAPPCKV